MVRQAAERLAGEGIVAGDAGNFSGWVSRYAYFRRYPSQLMPQSGAMGYAVPAALAAKLRHPERPVVCFVGDGGFQMSGLELATAAQQGLAIVVIVVNNAMYGTIRMHQERRYPGRVVATDLRNPDFPAIARACGADGELIERTDQFMPALERALASDRSTLLELRTAPEAISPSETHLLDPRRPRRTRARPARRPRRRARARAAGRRARRACRSRPRRARRRPADRSR